MVMVMTTGDDGNDDHDDNNNEPFPWWRRGTGVPAVKVTEGAGEP